ncbi:HNH endonuclease [Streptomyces phage Keanu]|nr:HNH endonuclease [Streptomyces phage Keanu]
MNDREQVAWGRLSEVAPRGRYEHPRTRTKRVKQRQNFVSRIDRRDGHWIWTGQTTTRDGKRYPMFSYRILGGGRDSRRQVMAFRHLMSECFPELVAKIPQRTAPACGEPMCVYPWHRANMMNTRQTITGEQALAIYQAKGTRSAADLASEYGISSEQVNAIWRGRSWRSVTGAPVPIPKRKVYDDDMVRRVLDLKGTGSSRAVAAELGIGYKFVLDVWAGVRQPKGSLSVAQDA